MRRLITLLTSLLLAANLFAQAPQKISYQAVIRGSENELITNQKVGIKISIIQNSADNTPLFVETHTPTTNENGLVTFSIGAGTAVTGTLQSINWEEGPYFIKVDTDITGGSSYTISGTSQILSVPYALYANSVNKEFVEGIVAEATAELANTIAQLQMKINSMEQTINEILDSLGIEVPALFIDDRDGNVYKYVTIGNQVWMAENLKYLPNVSAAADGSFTEPYHYVYGYNGTDVAEAKALETYQNYGVLYNWPAALEACPTGWHLPSKAEWDELLSFVDSENSKYSEIAGMYLKSCRQVGAPQGGDCATDVHPRWDFEPGVYAIDSYGFSGVPGGARLVNGMYLFTGLYGYHWTSTAANDSYSYVMVMYYFSDDVVEMDMYKDLGYSTRCIKD